MFTVACFCGFVYTVLHGRCICPSCGEAVEPNVFVESGSLDDVPDTED